MNLSIFAGALNLLPNFQERERERGGGLDMTTMFLDGFAGEDGGEIFQGSVAGFT